MCEVSNVIFLDIHKASDIIFPNIHKVNHVKYHSVDGIVTDITCPDINVVTYVFIRYTLFILYYYLKKSKLSDMSIWHQFLLRLTKYITTKYGITFQLSSTTLCLLLILFTLPC